MKKLMVVLAVCLTAIYGKANAQRIATVDALHVGDKKSVEVGEVGVAIENDNIGCGTYSIFNLQTRLVVALGEISSHLGTTMDFKEFGGHRVILSCVHDTRRTKHPRIEVSKLN